MKKTLLLLPVLLLLTSCQGEVKQPREEMLREICARHSSNDLTENDAREKLGLKENARVNSFCTFYRQGNIQLMRRLR